MSEDSYDSEEEEKEEEIKRTEMYKEIYETKMFLKVFNRKILDFDLKFPRNSFDRIIELYGEEKILPLSFVLFSNPYEITETIRYSTRNINVRTSVQINGILDLLSNYLVYPNSYETLNEIEKIRKAPKLKPKYLYSISCKMGLPYSEMVYYISFQMTEINIKELSKMIITTETYSLVFNLINLLAAKFGDKDSFEITFFSYRKILKMAGIELDKIIPYLDIFLVDSHNRQELNLLENSILCDKVRNRELRESIELNKRDQIMDIYNGIESINRMKKPEPINIFEPFREEASNLLLEFIEAEEQEEIEENENNEEKEEKEEQEENEEESDTINKKEINVIEDENIDNDNEVNENNEEEEIVEGENLTYLNDDQNINDDNKIIEDNQIIVNGENQEMNNEKGNEDSNELDNNKEKEIEIIDQVIYSRNNEQNNENKNKNENENKIIEQNNFYVYNENNINNDKEDEFEILESETFINLIPEKEKEEKENENKDDNNSNNISDKKDIFHKMKLVVKANKVTKKPFKIRRALFVKVEKEK